MINISEVGEVWLSNCKPEIKASKKARASLKDHLQRRDNETICLAGKNSVN